jgi:hypothetical protein
LSHPQALSELGTGTGTWWGDKSWENAPGMLLDVSLAADTLAGGLAPVKSLAKPKKPQIPCKPPKTPKRLLPGLKFDGKTGKLTQHAPDWGLGTKGKVPAGAADQVAKIAEAIYRRATEIKQGVWRGGVDDALFYSNGKHIVVTKSDGTFVTILKNAQSNKWFNQATSIWKQ